MFAFAGADGVLNDFPRLGVNAFGTVEVYLAFAAAEFGGFHGQFAIGGDDGQFAVAAGVYAFVFAPVVVVVVARVFFVEGLFVDKFCAQVGFFALDEGGAGFVAEVECGGADVCLVCFTEDDGAACGVAFELAFGSDGVAVVVALTRVFGGVFVTVSGFGLEVELFAGSGFEVFASIDGARAAVVGVAGMDVAVVAGVCTAVVNVAVVQFEGVAAANVAGVVRGFALRRRGCAQKNLPQGSGFFYFRQG